MFLKDVAFQCQPMVVQDFDWWWSNASESWTYAKKFLLILCLFKKKLTCDCQSINSMTFDVLLQCNVSSD